MRIQIRADSVEIDGYVNAVGRDSRTLTDEYGYSYKEQISPGTFARALQVHKENGQQIPVWLNHNDSRVLGGTDTNLGLEEDSIGLHAHVIIRDAEVVEKAKNKMLSGWSFGFIPLDSTEEYTSSCHRVIRTEIDLIEVSLIDDSMIPVYAGTSVHARADGKNDQVLIRAMDNDAIYHFAIEQNAEPEKHTPVEKKPVDYSNYNNTISKLRSFQ